MRGFAEILESIGFVIIIGLCAFCFGWALCWAAWGLANGAAARSQIIVIENKPYKLTEIKP